MRQNALHFVRNVFGGATPPSLGTPGDAYSFAESIVRGILSRLPSPNSVGGKQGAWSLPGGKLTTRTAVPLYQSLQVNVTDSAGLPDPDDVGLANSQSQFSVRFRNDTQRKVRMKTVRISNQDPTVFTVDLASGFSSPVAAFFGGSTRLFAVWTVPDGKLVLLKPLPIYKSQCVVYREFVEMTGDGTVVHVPLLGFEPLDG